ncbi:general transcription and DNA repair factor IIH subunit TFB1-1-like isoform X1 [Dioscorea cayenensis subsp. rotundata]|uniref:General transcription and DNA repair factor IIH subunit TFB1-1-like isoform X1 n=1 Tax=Dioscorea cayennensis subsp. rotundata TaxID=55577 RepID=A0AB40AVX3_DIOCR|nr:general transcription and DNA repair factor IIH subunit TFB1-1-like isoform X1 [Dioscorea cayenensis subsp. rotundata]
MAMTEFAMDQAKTRESIFQATKTSQLHPVQNLHKQLVASGILMDSEFWAARKMLSWETQEQWLKHLQGLSTENSDENVHMEKSERVCHMTEIEDLQAPQSFPVAPLCIKDPREYFDSQQANALRVRLDHGIGMVMVIGMG